jgi:hypothetical protein
MRIALALMLFAGCIQPAPDPGPDPGPGPDPTGGWGTGPGGTGGDSGYGCHADTECGTGYVCARDGECLTSSQVRTIHVTWTVAGATADATSCANEPHLDITFVNTDNDEQFGFSPVPCVEGKFTIDKLPTRFGSVELSKTGDYSNYASGVFGSDGTVALDLSN